MIFDNDDSGFAYLASPHTHSDPAVVEWREKAIMIVAGKLIQMGLQIFCPIMHTAALDREIKIPHHRWLMQDQPIFDASRLLIVVQLPGWEKSVGITAEIERAKKRKKPIFYMYISEDIFNSPCPAIGN